MSLPLTNEPELWVHWLPWPARDTHKYARGHLGVFTGGALTSGAGRLAARAGARMGAGAVTALCPPSAALVVAMHQTAVMVRKVDGVEDWREFHAGARARAYVLGPGFGRLALAGELALAILGSDEPVPLVLDADGITAFRDDPEVLFSAAGQGAMRLVLTPHEGEFARLFPQSPSEGTSREERATRAAREAGGVVVLKGAETVVAEAGGRVAVNRNGSPFLATAGSGDVLAGMIGGLLAQGMDPFEAACAAVWMHAEAGARFGAGLTADDLPNALLPVLRDFAPRELRPRGPDSPER